MAVHEHAAAFVNALLRQCIIMLQGEAVLDCRRCQHGCRRCCTCIGCRPLA